MKRALVLSLICVLGLTFTGLAATLSGSWDTDVTIDPLQSNFSAAISLDSIIEVIYTVGSWTFTSTTTLDESGWADQTFDVLGVLGAFDISSALAFDPDAPEFTSWDVSAGLLLAGVQLGAEFSLFNVGDIAEPTWYDIITDVLEEDPDALDPQPVWYPNDMPFVTGNDLTLALTGSGTAGDVTVDVEVTFGAANYYVFFVEDAFGWDADFIDADTGQWVLIPLMRVVHSGGASTNYVPVGGEWVLASSIFDEVRYDSFITLIDFPNPLMTDWNDRVVEECDLDWTGITIDIGFPFCCADITLGVEFDCDGFVSATFATGGIAIPNLPWLTIDAEIVFTIDEKFVTLEPAFTFGDIVCFDLDIDVEYTGGDMSVLSLNNFIITGISLTCTIGGVDFTGATTFDADALFGDDEIYFEYYSIATADDGCCGPFDFDLTFYFLEGGIKLFDVALIEANMSLQIASQFTFNMGLDIDVNTGSFTEWTVGFLVTW